MFNLKKWRSTFAKSHEDLFLEVIQKEGLFEKMFPQKLTQNFFGQIRQNSGQNLSHPKTFAFFYTYVLHYTTFPDFCVQQSHATNPHLRSL